MFSGRLTLVFLLLYTHSLTHSRAYASSTHRVRYKETGSEGGFEVPDPRGSHTTVAVRDQLYVFGGQKENGPCDELWTFNIATR